MNPAALVTAAAPLSAAIVMRFDCPRLQRASASAVEGTRTACLLPADAAADAVAPHRTAPALGAFSLPPADRVQRPGPPATTASLATQAPATPAMTRAAPAPAVSRASGPGSPLVAATSFAGSGQLTAGQILTLPD